MQEMNQQKAAGFVNRRKTGDLAGPPGVERRQFRDAGSDRPEIRELSDAIDQYKLCHRRRFITYEELYDVLTDLGYHK